MKTIYIYIYIYIYGGSIGTAIFIFCYSSRSFYPSIPKHDEKLMRDVTSTTFSQQITSG